jgi:hypothetical protein
MAAKALRIANSEIIIAKITFIFRNYSDKLGKHFSIKGNSATSIPCFNM